MSWLSQRAALSSSSAPVFSYLLNPTRLSHSPSMLPFHGGAPQTPNPPASTLHPQISTPSPKTEPQVVTPCRGGPLELSTLPELRVGPCQPSTSVLFPKCQSIIPLPFTLRPNAGWDRASVTVRGTNFANTTELTCKTYSNGMSRVPRKTHTPKPWTPTSKR